MKRMIVATLLVALLLCGCSSSILPLDLPNAKSTTTPTTMPTTMPTELVITYETYYVVDCAESISMYADADINSKTLCTIPLGAGVSFIKNAANGFSNIAYQGETGYVLATNLSKEAPVIEEVEYVTYYVVNCQSSITMRKSPSTKADSVKKIPLGAAVSYISTAENGFCKISYMGKTGYALASYLSQDPNASVNQPLYPRSDGKYPVFYVVDCSKNITLRSSPSTKASSLGKIPLGAAVSYIATVSNGFYQVRYDGKIGYALAQYLSPFEGEMYNGTFAEVVNCEKSVSLRTTPSTKAKAYCQIPLGEMVEYLAKDTNGFCLVWYDGYVGYVLEKYLD